MTFTVIVNMGNGELFRLDNYNLLPILDPAYATVVMNKFIALGFYAWVAVEG
jgi:hypothetical protein